MSHSTPLPPQPDVKTILNPVFISFCFLFCAVSSHLQYSEKHIFYLDFFLTLQKGYCAMYSLLGLFLDILLLRFIPIIE